MLPGKRSKQGMSAFDCACYTRTMSFFRELGSMLGDAHQLVDEVKQTAKDIAQDAVQAGQDVADSAQSLKDQVADDVAQTTTDITGSLDIK